MLTISKKQQRTILRVAGWSVIALIICTAIVLLSRMHFAVLEPKGVIAGKQRDLLVFASLLSLVVILPVFALTFHIVRTYRVDAKKKAKYSPDWDHNRRLETLWWGIPSLIIIILSVVTWQSSHALDPSKALVSEKPPMTIQVIALEWKWLFIYPEQHIATVNYVKFPVNQPVTFNITADAPMNSLWIPQLGGQIYAMNGMTTKLHLMADQTGTFQGSSANLSGKGFAGMRFPAEALTDRDFESWAMDASQAPNTMDVYAYDALAKPSTDNLPATFRLTEGRLYDTVMMKYMGHGQTAGNSSPSKDTKDTTGMDMAGDSNSMEGTTMEMHHADIQ